MNKRILKKRLNNLANNVAKRGVFVVVKDANGYYIQNYLNKTIICNDIPVRKLAEKICDLRNKGKQLSTSQKIHARSLSAKYNKLRYDLVFFNHSMANAKDFEDFCLAESRKSDVLGKIYSIKRQLESI